MVRLRLNLSGTNASRENVAFQTDGSISELSFQAKLLVRFDVRMCKVDDKAVSVEVRAEAWCDRRKVSMKMSSSFSICGVENDECESESKCE